MWNLELRNAPPITMGEGSTFSGIALAWNDSTGPLPELNGYRERFEPHALRWDENTSLYLGHNHELQIPLAREGAGTLSIRSTDSGLQFSGKMPNWSHHIQEALSRGDLSGAVSIGFIVDPKGSTFNNRAKLRTVRAARLHHIGIVPQGAYPSAQGSMQ